MKMLVVISAVLPILLASCSWDPAGVNAQGEWLAQKEKEKLEYDKQVAVDQENRLKKQKEATEKFESSHPEVEIGKMDVGTANSAENKLGRAMNNLGFVTRYPGEQNLDNVYVKVGTYNLSVRRFQLAVKGYSDECKRASAYNNSDYKNLCVSNLASALNNFSDMLKNKSIPDQTKSTALSEASYDSYIDFEHAARLASMHAKLCQQQGNQGYVEMVTVAAPCSGRGDVLNISAARQMGLL